MKRVKRNYVWIAKSRAKAQRALLELYGLLDKQRPTIEADAEQRGLFGLLLGVAFSLWRAALLEDATRKWPLILDDGKVLLEKLIGDNAIAYSQERDTNEWMGGYYLNSARYRLMRVREKLKLPRGRRKELRALLEDLSRSGWTERKTPRDAWDAMHLALVELSQLLRERVGAKQPNNRMQPTARRKKKSRG